MNPITRWIMGSLLLLTSYAKAHFTESYFSDTEVKGTSSINYVVTDTAGAFICGKAFNKIRYNSFIAKIDTDGRNIWCTSDYDTATILSIDAFIHSSDGYIYSAGTWHDMFGYAHFQLWKVDATYGTIVWKTPFTAYNYYVPDGSKILDYDSSKFIIVSPYDYDGSYYDMRVAFIDKHTGLTIQNKTAARMLGNNITFAVALDSERNFYHTYGDTIFKRSAANFDSIIWKKSYSFYDSLLDFGILYFDANDEMFGMGTGASLGWSNCRVSKFDRISGNKIWSHVNTYTVDANPIKVVDKFGQLYISWYHKYVGGNIVNYWTSKIDKQTTNGWDNYYPFHGVGTGVGWHSGGQQAALDIDVDDNGDIYETGYYGDANYGPEQWGILKLTGTTGNSIYENTLTEDSVNYNDLSQGMKVWLVHNVPHYIGVIERHHYPYDVYTDVTGAILRCNPTTGNFVYEQYLGGGYQFPSKTVSIKKVGHNNVVLKQTGRSITIELYDYANTLKWRKQIYKLYLITADLLSIDNTGTINVGAHNTGTASTPPYYNDTYTDSIFLFTLDTNGVFGNTAGFRMANNFPVYPIELANNGNDRVLFFRYGNGIACNKISNGTNSANVNLNVSYSPIFPSAQKVTADGPDSLVTVFVSRSSLSRVLIMNKNTLSYQLTDTIPLIKNINHVATLSNGNFLLTGNTSQSYDIALCLKAGTYDTLWAKTYSPNCEILKFAFNADSTYCYTMGYDNTLNNSARIVLRKLRVADGAQQWAYTYASNVTGNNYPLDIIYDKLRNHIVITGYVYDTTAAATLDNQVFVLITDDAGGIVGSYIKQGEFAGSNTGFCLGELADGRIWIGGNYSQHLYGKAGFIYDLGLPFVTETENFTRVDLTNKITCYPNPFTNNVNVQLQLNQNSNDVLLEVYDITGKRIYSEYKDEVGAGLMQCNFQLATSSGMYLLKATINGEVYCNRLMGVK